MRGCWVLVCFAFLPLLVSPLGGGTTHVQVRWGRSDSFCFIMGCHFYVLLSLDEMVFFLVWYSQRLLIYICHKYS